MEFLFLCPFDPTTVVSSRFLLLKLVTAHRIFMEISWTFLAFRLTTPASLVTALLLCTSNVIYSLWSLRCASGLFDVRLFESVRAMTSSLLKENHPQKSFIIFSGFWCGLFVRFLIGSGLFGGKRLRVRSGSSRSNVREHKCATRC